LKEKSYNQLAVRRSEIDNKMTANPQARVLQPIPATVPSLQNTCFLAYPDYPIMTTIPLDDYFFKSISIFFSGKL
jgi:hypothetical protein